MGSQFQLSFALLVCAAWAAPAQGGSGGEQYDVAGSFTFGCFDPCLCPIWLTDDLTGSFSLAPLLVLFPESHVIPPGTIALTPYVLADVELIVGGAAGGGQHWTGTGTYALLSSDMGTMQQMQLDLTTDGKTFTHFDSGLVEGGDGFPSISIAVSINGMFCLDTVFSIAATPDAPMIGDLNGDGVVDGLDLGIMLGQWTASGALCGPIFCPADLNHDGVVDGLDLGLLLDNWSA